MPRMAVPIYFYNIFEEKQVIVEGGKQNFFQSEILGRGSVGFYLTKFLTRCNQWQRSPCL